MFDIYQTNKLVFFLLINQSRVLWNWHQLQLWFHSVLKTFAPKISCRVRSSVSCWFCLRKNFTRSSRPWFKLDETFTSFSPTWLLHHPPPQLSIKMLQNFQWQLSATLDKFKIAVIHNQSDTHLVRKFGNPSGSRTHALLCLNSEQGWIMPTDPPHPGQEIWRQILLFCKTSAFSIFTWFLHRPVIHGLIDVGLVCEVHPQKQKPHVLQVLLGSDSLPHHNCCFCFVVAVFHTHHPQLMFDCWPLPLEWQGSLEHSVFCFFPWNCSFVGTNCQQVFAWKLTLNNLHIVNLHNL